METLVILLSAVIPALVMVYFIYRKDKYEKEPAGQLLKGFGYGALAALASFFISVPGSLAGLFPKEINTVGDGIRTAFFAAAIPEELVKLLFLWLLLRKNQYYNEYVDGAVYAVCVGMGFAALENIIYLFSETESWAAVGVLRALFSIPGHFFFAVIMGYYYSKASFGDRSRRHLNMLLAFVLPMLLHALFDALLMVSKASGAVGALILLFLGLYIYMAVTTKKRFNQHLARDEKRMGSPDIFS